MDANLTTAIVTASATALVAIVAIVTNNRRLGDMNTRIGSLENSTTARFSEVSERISSAESSTNARITSLEDSMNARFSEVNTRIAGLEESTNARFISLESSMNTRFSLLESKLDHIEQLLVGYALDVARIKERLGM